MSYPYAPTYLCADPSAKWNGTSCVETQKYPPCTTGDVLDPATSMCVKTTTAPSTGTMCVGKDDLANGMCYPPNCLPNETLDACAQRHNTMSTNTVSNK